MSRLKEHARVAEGKIGPQRRKDLPPVQRVEHAAVLKAAYSRAQSNGAMLTATDALVLQRTVGNRKLQRYVGSHPLNPQIRMGHESTREVGQNGAKSAASFVIQRNGGSSQTNLQKLDELLDRFNVPEEEVIDLLGRLTTPEKKAVLAGGYQSKIASALNIGEMVRAVNHLNPELTVKLRWVESAAQVRTAINYSDIQAMIKAPHQSQRDMLKTIVWRNFFIDVCDNTTMRQAVDDLGFDLKTKLEWLRGEMTSVRAELSYADIKPMILTALQAERDVLKTSAWRDFFVQVCDNTTMPEAVSDLGLDAAMKLDWMLEEGVSWYTLKITASAIIDSEVDVTLKHLDAVGKLDQLLKEIPSSEYTLLSRFYYGTLDPTAKEKVAAYYKGPEEQARGMELIHEPGRDIKYPWHDIVDPSDPTRKLYDHTVDENENKGYLNPDYWTSLGGWTFQLKVGKKASEGIETIFEGPTRLECLAMANVLHFRTLLRMLGHEKFDKRFNWTNLVVGASSTASTVLNPYLTPVTSITPAGKESVIQKGDWVYFENHPKYSMKHPGGAWSGENAFCMGKGGTAGQNLYRGFGVPKMNDAEMVAALKLQYDRDRTGDERLELAKEIVNIYPGAFPTDLAGVPTPTPSNADIDMWISSHPGTDFDEYHTSKFPDKASIADIPGLIMPSLDYLGPTRIKIP